MEGTYATDLRALDDCQRELSVFVEQLAVRAERAHAGNMVYKIYVKLRFASFRDTTVECISP